MTPERADAIVPCEMPFAAASRLKPSSQPENPAALDAAPGQRRVAVERPANSASAHRLAIHCRIGPIRPFAVSE